MVDAESDVVVLPMAERLDSWKEIAAYLKRTERTVRRWEKLEGLPVHRLRHDKRGSVYAYVRELDGWLESRSVSAEAAQPDVPIPAASESPAQRRPATLVIGVTATAIALLIIGVIALRSTQQPRANLPPEVVRQVERANFASPGRAQIAAAIKYDEDAIRLDPKYALAWARLGVSHVALVWFGEVPAKQSMGEAQTDAREALRLDPSQSEAWRVLGWASHYLDWDQKAAEAEFQKAIQLDPHNEGALFWYSEFLLDLRRFDEALTYSRRAQEAAPRWLMPVVGYGNAYYMNGHVELAIPEYQRALELDPNFGVAVHFLGLAHLIQGHIDQAVGELRKANDLLGQVPVSVASLGYALGIAGRQGEAESLLNDLLQRRNTGYYPAFAIAQIELGLGRTDAALDWLERAADERHIGYYFPIADPIYRHLGTNPRFMRLMVRALAG